MFLAVAPVMGRTGAAASLATTADCLLLRGGAVKKAAAAGPLGIFVQTVMDSRRHLVAAAGKTFNSCPEILFVFVAPAQLAG